MISQNIMYRKIRHFIDSQSFIFFIITLLIFLGFFLRVYGIDKVYTEYDDIGVVSIHKAHLGEKTINPLGKVINYPIKVDMESVHSIENNLILPFYIGFTWTYAPGQYFILPLLLDKDDDFDEVLFKGRILSSIFSIIGIILLAYLMYSINRGVFNWVFPVALSIPIFSSNSILYAHHMSPYSAYFFSMSVGLFLLYQYFIQKITFRKLVVVLSFLFYLSYLTILFAIPSLILYLNNINDTNLSGRINKYLRDLVTLCISILIITPGLLILKTSSGGKGINSPEFDGLLSLHTIFNHLLSQIHVSLVSIVHGFIRFDYLLLFFTITLSLLLAKFFIFDFKKMSQDRLYFISTLSILLQWLILHIFGFLPLDATRHLLIILPIVSFAVFYLLKDTNMKKYSLLLFLLISVASYSASKYSINLIESKFSNFNYSVLDSRNEKVILLYRSTLGPLKYYDNKDKKIYFIDVNSFRTEYESIKFPNEILLVSQQTEIFNERLYEKYKKTLPGIFCNYAIKKIYEKDSETFFTYDNYDANSNKNGMFVYQLKKTNINQC